MQRLQEDLDRARQAGSAISAVSAELEPVTLLEMSRGLRASLVASLRTGMLNSASMFGMSVNIGDAVALTVNRTTAPWLAAGIRCAVAHSRTEIQLLSQDPNARGLIQCAIRGFSNSIGLAVASYVDVLAFTVTNARTGAAMMTREVAIWLGFTRRTEERTGGLERPLLCLLEWALFGAGVFSQFFRGSSGMCSSARRFLPGASTMPGLMRLVLGVPLVAETWLGASVIAMRAGLLD